MHDLSPILILFGQAFVIALSGALMPGPLLTVTISESLAKGARAGPFVVFGHAIAEILIITALAFGIGVFLQRSVVTGFIAVIGGLALIVTGIFMARGAVPAAEQAITALGSIQANSSGGTLRCIYLGAVISLSSPYWILWWLTPGLLLLTKGLRIGPTGVAAFYSGHILADLIWYWLVAFAVSRGVHWLTSRGYARVLVGCAVVLLALGVMFTYGGTRILTTGVVPKM